VATDSAASLLRDGSRESGQGRWDEIFLEGLCLREFAALQAVVGETAEETLSRIPNLARRYLALGGFPEHAASTDLPEARRRLRSDIADRAVLRDLAGLGVDVQRVKDLLVYLLQDSGAELKIEARAGDLRADARSVREWVRLLLDTLLVVSLDRFSRHAAASLRARPRLYAADPGLVAAFALSPPQMSGESAGVFEAAVFRHLREEARFSGGELSYFRQDDDLEIDFVLDRGGELTGIEVTSSPRVRSDKIKRVQRAGAALGAGRLLLVHGGALEETIGEVQAVSLTRFLLHPAACLTEGS
jgi:predicted AAA+ superfamily ATPase